MVVESVLSKFLSKQKPKRLYVAVSGGIDSMVLLDAISSYKNEYIIEIIHVNHHLTDESSDWQKLVEEKSARYGLKFRSFDISISSQSGIEEQCREARYKAMASYIQGKGMLLTAHHQEDQRETSLFRLLRGSSLRGLVGMQELSQLSGLQIGRPLLPVIKRSIQEYAKTKELEWVEDPSNNSHIHTRNRIRRLLEGIHDINGYRTTQMHLARQHVLLEESVHEKLILIKTNGGLSISKLCQLSNMWQEEVLYYWLSSQVGLVSHSCLPNILEMMVSAKVDRHPSYRFGDYQLLRYRDILSIVVIPTIPNAYIGNDLEVHIGIGVFQNTIGNRLALSYLSGEASQYKKIFQKFGVPSWLRAFMPITNQIGNISLEANIKDYEQAFNKAFREINNLKL